VNDAPIVRVQRVMPAAPRVVFDQWLDPESLAEWMCPRPTRVVDLTVEPRVGGNVRFDIDDSGTSVLITGRFLAIDRPHLLRFTWSTSDWPDPMVVSVVTVAFEPIGEDQTLMSMSIPCCPRHLRRIPKRVGGRLRSARHLSLPTVRKVERE
jgi:uncharacterized protein YndB with AHSA1/START domain